MFINFDRLHIVLVRADIKPAADGMDQDQVCVFAEKGTESECYKYPLLTLFIHIDHSLRVFHQPKSNFHKRVTSAVTKAVSLSELCTCYA